MCHTSSLHHYARKYACLHGIRINRSLGANGGRLCYNFIHTLFAIAVPSEVLWRTLQQKTISPDKAEKVNVATIRGFPASVNQFGEYALPC